ncbi:MAG TPA: aminotransferase class V-fold PLP-dependent enzyme, partial [Microbacterium sp.]|nr:aminotransferase class V-fold PLP-dependent enzyme [Microbacterium sp.]
MGLFRSSPRPGSGAGADAFGASRDGFGYLGAGEVYLDAACQSLRPQPVLDAMAAYATGYPACGDRVAYAWGARVSTEVEATRAAALATFGLSPRRHSCAFTLNTTYGLNLLLHQLPRGRYARVVTSHAEHNAVFLSTMTAARRLGIPRDVVDRVVDPARGVARLDLGSVDLTDAVLVVSAMDNVTGMPTDDLPGLVAAVHARGGIVIVDAAQAAPHARAALHGLAADALCL